MTQVILSCLGVIQVSLNGEVLQFDTDKVRALLIYLAIEAARPQRREHLAGLLWSDQPEERALHNLRQALSSLRKSLKDDLATQPVLHIEREEVQINPECQVWLDVRVFANYLDEAYRHYQRRTGKGRLNVRALQQALSLYHGPFLEQFYLSGSPVFDEWASLQREALNQRAIEALGLLSAYHEQRGEFTLARQAAAHIVAMAPWEESAHVRVMRLLAYDGQWSAAQNQYQILHRYLEKELGVEPLAETVALNEEIQQAAARQAPLVPRLPSVKHNLPPPSTPFVGRQVELEQMAAFIANPDCRLLTLLGAGGIGKTRLALETAHEQVGIFRHGVFFIALASLPSGELLATAIAEVLGFRFSGASDSHTQLLNYLRNKELLLVLDNFEHLLEGAGFLADILHEAHDVTILVTSRLPLQLRAECILEVDGLSVPASRVAGVNEVGWQTYSALVLFEQTARRLRPHFRLEKELDSVTRICQLVDGSPLAIELSAASLRQQSCGEIARAIEKDLDALTTSMRDVPERHRSMRAVFNHSWQLLSREEQYIFCKLAVFRGGFTAQAARVVSGAEPTLLRSLADKVLLRMITVDRYDLHRLVGQFAAEKLAENEAECCHTYDAHAACYAEFLEDLAQPIRGSGQLEALASIGSEIENVRQAWKWAVDQARADWFAQMLSTLAYFYEIRSWFQEGRDVFANAVASLQPKPSNNPVILGRLFVAQAMFESMLGENEPAKELAEQGLELLRPGASTSVTSRGLNVLGAVLFDLGERERSVVCFEESYALDGDKSEKAFAALYLGHIARYQGNFPLARQYFEQSLALYTELGDLWGRSKNLSNVGMIYGMLGEYKGAQQAFEQSQVIYTQIGDQAGLARCLHNLSIVAYIDKDFLRARDLRLGALKICQDIGYQWGVASTLKHLGDVEKSLGELERAQQYYRESLQVSEQIKNGELRLSNLNSLANLYITQNELTRAYASYHEALDLALSLGSVPVVVDVVAGIGEVSLLSGKLDEAGLLLGFASVYQGADRQTQDKAEQLLTSLAEKLPENQVQRLRQQGQDTPYEEIIQIAGVLPSAAP
jgi:predicted ATPase